MGRRALSLAVVDRPRKRTHPSRSRSTGRHHRRYVFERETYKIDGYSEMKHSRVTVNLINKNKNLKGTKDIFRVMEQATRILNECSYPPSTIVEHVFDDRLTAIEIEFHFPEIDISEAEIKAGNILNCVEDQLRGIFIFVNDVYAEDYQ